MTLMQTQASDAHTFHGFDLSRVPSPCFVVDEVAVERNLAILKDVADRSGAQIFLALKAFSMFALAPQYQILAYFDANKPPDALVFDARELVRSMGYTEEPADSISGFGRGHRNVHGHSDLLGNVFLHLDGVGRSAVVVF